MCVCWSAASFSYYMIGYYNKYIPGNVYTIIIVSSMAEVSSTLLTGVMATYIGCKKTFIICFTVGLVFGVSLVLLPESEIFLILIAVLLTKGGVSGAFNICYLITPEYFPILYTSSAFGVCNIFARSTTIFAFVIAEMTAPFPMIVYSALCLLSIACITIMLSKAPEWLSKPNLLYK